MAHSKGSKVRTKIKGDRRHPRLMPLDNPKKLDRVSSIWTTACGMELRAEIQVSMWVPKPTYGIILYSFLNMNAPSNLLC